VNIGYALIRYTEDPVISFGSTALDAERTEERFGLGMLNDVRIKRQDQNTTLVFAYNNPNGIVPSDVLIAARGMRDAAESHLDFEVHDSVREQHGTHISCLELNLKNTHLLLSTGCGSYQNNRAGHQAKVLVIQGTDTIMCYGLGLQSAVPPLESGYRVGHVLDIRLSSRLHTPLADTDFRFVYEGTLPEKGLTPVFSKMLQEPSISRISAPRVTERNGLKYSTVDFKLQKHVRVLLAAKVDTMPSG